VGPFSGIRVILPFDGFSELIALIVYALRALLAAVLVVSSTAKLVDLPGFERTLRQLRLPGTMGVTRRLAVAVPCLELILGELSISGVAQQYVAVAVLIVFVGFTLVTAAAFMTGSDAQCRCFGALTGSQFTKGGLVRGLSLTAGAAVVSIWFSAGNRVAWSPLESVLVAAGFLVLGAAAAQASYTIARIHDSATAGYR